MQQYQIYPQNKILTPSFHPLLFTIFTIIQHDAQLTLKHDVVVICVELMCNGEVIVVKIFNVVTPDTFNDNINKVLLCNIVIPDLFNVDVNVAE